MPRYEVNIGLEVHAQLLTRTKLFCGCSTAYGAAPNTHVCPTCLGLPGALPVLNQTAVEFAIRMGLAAGCRIHRRSRFARKNYFYPDCPKNYQITQYDRPLLSGGQIEAAGGVLELDRIHLEEDAGKLIHMSETRSSLVDLNRCGVPLIEIVSRPVLGSAAAASGQLKNIRRMLRYLGICDGNMEEGSLRCDVNVSLRPAGDETLGAKTEIKNLNSFRAVEEAIDFEIQRQQGILSRGERVVPETLLWQAETGSARVMRSKEETRDYRYFEEPDLPELVVSEAMIERAAVAVPELPARRAGRFVEEYRIPAADAEVLTSSRELADYFEAVTGNLRDPKSAGDWVREEVLRELKERRIGLPDLTIGPAALAELIEAEKSGRLNRPTARQVFREMAATGSSAGAVIESRGLHQISAREILQPIVEKVLAAHPAEVQAYRRGKHKLMTFFIGQLMKETGGRANPRIGRELLAVLLEGKR
jgi:aspartyl-tRNA(Asn)/glutamyl-tRNA(Gln) amidotransferase subunit B